MKQELHALPKHLQSPLIAVLSGVCVAASFAFCALSCELLSFRFFYYTAYCIIRPLTCLF